VLTVEKQSLIFSSMTTQQPTAAPDRFVRLLRLGLASQPLSLRKVAEKVGVSPAYLSRLVNGERGLPTDDTTIAKLEQVLDFPPGRLFDAAERPDLLAKTFLKKQQARPMMRTLAHLSDDDLANVQAVLDKLDKKYYPIAK